MVYPRECYQQSTYNVDTQELLLRRDRGMYVPFMYSLLLANASNHAIYLSCEGGRQDTLRQRWKRADPATRGCEPPLITFALAAYLASEYATKYSTKPDGMNIKVPLLRVVRALDECRSRGADTTLNPDSTSSQTQGRRFISRACNAVNGAQVIPATMAALYLLLQNDHFISHEFVTHSANLFTKDYMMKRKVWSTMFPCPLYYTPYIIWCPILTFHYAQMDTDGIDDSAPVTLLGVDSTPFSRPVTALQNYQSRPAELSALSPFAFTMLFAKDVAPHTKPGSTGVNLSGTYSLAHV